eukprot:6726181-Prymnesium_polylepis.1
MHSSSIVIIILRGSIIELPDGSFMYNMRNIPDWAQVALDYLGITTTLTYVDHLNASPEHRTVATWHM